MKKVFLIIVAIILGLVIGLGSLRTIITSVSGQVNNGPWTTDLTTGGIDASAYTRASLAVQGLLAMTQDQAVYFIAENDSAGQTLDASCEYTLTGGDLPTRWWSITMYAADYFFVPNDQKRYAVSKSSLSRIADTNGQWLAKISNQDSADLIAPQSGPFSMIVRLYNPEPVVSENPTSLTLPTISRGACT